MAKYNYGKTFKKNGKLLRYRYTNKDISTKKLVDAKTKKLLLGKKPVAQRAKRTKR